MTGFSYTNKDDLVNAVRSLPYPGLETYTAASLKVMRTQVFNTPGDRPDVRNVAIIITDGQPTDINALPAEIAMVYAQGIITFSIGITDKIDEKTLKSLSSPPQKVY